MGAELPNSLREWKDKVFAIDAAGFEAAALDAFRLQYQYNTLYGEFARAVGRTPENVERWSDIPFMPISFFKTRQVTTGSFEPELVFESSGTTGMINSRHFVKDRDLYVQSFLSAFELFYGSVEQYCVLALLPSYLERQNSSLVLMADGLIKRSGHHLSGFYLYDHSRLEQTLQQLEATRQPTLLLGVSFALLDFAEAHPMQLQHTIVMETGGMKGRREEWTREAVHDFLKQRLGLPAVHSEYGMTELLSQAYSKGNGIFYCPPWMRIHLREEDDPLQVASRPAGIINVTDLVNIDSCCFIATEDAGRIHPGGGFEITGRTDHSDLRGCSLMVS